MRIMKCGYTEEFILRRIENEHHKSLEMEKLISERHMNQTIRYFSHIKRHDAVMKTRFEEKVEG